MVDPDFLALMPLFSPLSAPERGELAALMVERRYHKGTTLFTEGDPSERAIFVHSGRVKVYRLTSGGHEQILGIFGPRQPVGMVAVLSGFPYPASAEAAEDCTVYVIRRADLLRFIEAHPAVALQIMREMGARLRSAYSRVHAMAARSLVQRLGDYLLEQVQRHGPTFQLAMTHQELGAYLGASRETVTRALADLRREGVLRVNPDDTITVDAENLRRWLE